LFFGLTRRAAIRWRKVCGKGDENLRSDTRHSSEERHSLERWPRLCEAEGESEGGREGEEDEDEFAAPEYIAEWTDEQEAGEVAEMTKKITLC
jgi:hypothetical protein